MKLMMVDLVDVIVPGAYILCVFAIHLGQWGYLGTGFIVNEYWYCTECFQVRSVWQQLDTVRRVTLY